MPDVGFQTIHLHQLIKDKQSIVFSPTYALNG
jgi:hypothetical protein